MKIMFLLTQDLESPSGLGRYLPLGRELARLGNQVTIAALHSNYAGLAQPRFSEGNLAVWYVGQMHVHKEGNVKKYFPARKLAGVALRATWQLTRAALAAPADIVHIGKPHPMNSIAGLVARMARRRVFLDCDDYEAASGHFSGRWQQAGVKFFEDRMPLWVDCVTSNTYFTLERIATTGVANEKLVYLSNGVERARFTLPDPNEVAGLRTRFGLEGKKVVLFLGSLSYPSHPVDLLFEAFQHVRQAEPQAVLLLVGGGDQFEQLQAMAAAMGLDGAVHFCGRVPPQDARLYYHLAQVSVDPVHDDGGARGRSPLKLFESWACGVPFVTADVGDRARLLGSPPAGLLAQPGDPASLAEAIVRVLSQPALANQLRSLGLQRVESYYWDHLARDLDQTYRAYARSKPAR